MEPRSEKKSNKSENSSESNLLAIQKVFNKIHFKGFDIVIDASAKPKLGDRYHKIYNIDTKGLAVSNDEQQACFAQNNPILFDVLYHLNPVLLSKLFYLYSAEADAILLNDDFDVLLKIIRNDRTVNGFFCAVKKERDARNNLCYIDNITLFSSFFELLVCGVDQSVDEFKSNQPSLALDVHELKCLFIKISEKLLVDLILPKCASQRSSGGHKNMRTILTSGEMQQSIFYSAGKYILTELAAVNKFTRNQFFFLNTWVNAFIKFFNGAKNAGKNNCDEIHTLLSLFKSSILPSIDKAITVEPGSLQEINFSDEEAYFLAAIYQRCFSDKERSKFHQELEATNASYENKFGILSSHLYFFDGKTQFPLSDEPSKKKDMIEEFKSVILKFEKQNDCYHDDVVRFLEHVLVTNGYDTTSKKLAFDIFIQELSWLETAWSSVHSDMTSLASACEFSIFNHPQLPNIIKGYYMGSPQEAINKFSKK